MSKNYTQLQTALQAWWNVGDKRLDPDVAGDVINWNRRQILRRNHGLRFTEISDTLSVLAGDFDYDLPTGYAWPYLFWYLHPTTNAYVTLKRKTLEELRKLHPDTSKTGDPEIYTVWGSEMLIAPTPDTAFTLNRDYRKTLTDLSAGNLTDDFNDAAWDLVFWWSMAHIALYMFEDPRGPKFESTAQKLEDDFIQEHSKERSVGRIVESKEPG